MPKSWQTAAREKAQTFANCCFSQWLQSKQGKRWKALKSRQSPYLCGFSLPAFHHDLIEALNQDDEQTVKALVLRHYV